MNKYLNILLLSVFVFCGCADRNTDNSKPEEDKAAKQLLQGVWLNEDDEEVAFRAKGDTIYYPDMTSLPVYFSIIDDTLFLQGTNVAKYPIVKQAEHIFQFQNQNGEVVHLVKTADKSYLSLFIKNAHTAVLNQNQVIKSDTIVNYGQERYHCYVQINPTTYKVVKTAYNDEGVEVENVYFDNIIHLAVYSGQNKFFSKDFRKSDFCKLVPGRFLSQAILNDMEFSSIDGNGIHYDAIINIPDSPSSYLVEIIVGYQGTLKMVIK